MSYIPGHRITTEEYNSFLNSAVAGVYGINYIIGAGSGNLGLGQTTLVNEQGTAKAGEIVTAAQWNELFTQMDTIANHTNDTMSFTEPRTAGEIITVVAGINSDIQTLASSIEGGCVNTTALTVGSTDIAQASGAVWDTEHQAEISYTFAGGDEARWFFNQGGSLRVTFENSATNSTGLDTVITGLQNAISDFRMGATTSEVTGNLNDSSDAGDSSFTGSTTPFTGALGYYDLTTSYQTLLYLLEQSGTYDYSYEGQVAIRIEGKVNTAHGDGLGNNGDVVTLRVTLSQLGSNNAQSATQDFSGSHAKAEENSCGPTTINFSTVDVNTTEGLVDMYNSITVAKVSARRIDDGVTTSL